MDRRATRPPYFARPRKPEDQSVIDAAPLILTLDMDAASRARFEAERRAHFPPARNLIPAHLTLFHHLPGERLDEIAAQLDRVARDTPRFAMAVPTLRFLGAGTAYVVESAGLQRLRAVIAAHWAEHLTRQDAQGFRPHVTIQNKVPAARARALYDMLAAEFEPFAIEATGLLLWHYRGGPWEAAGAFPFVR